MDPPMAEIPEGFPNEVLQNVTLTVEEHNAQARALMSEIKQPAFDASDTSDEAVMAWKGYNESVMAYVDFMLTLRSLDDEDRDARARVNSRLGDHTISDGDVQSNISITRDVDSVIALTQDLPFSSDETFHVYPVAKFSEAITADVKVHGSVVMPDGSRHQKLLHQIPNFALGKIDHRHVCVVFLGKATAPGQSRRVSQDDLAAFYNDILLPCAREVDITRHWPHSYAHAVQLSRGQQGRLSYKTLDVAGKDIEQFGAHMRRLMDAHSTFAHSFFGHFYRGYKGATYQLLGGLFTPPEDDDEAALADHVGLNEAARPISRTIRPGYDTSNFYYDVALEFRSKDGRALLWNAMDGASFAILRYLLPHATDEELTAFMQTSSTEYFLKDFAALNLDVAGARAKLPTLGKDLGIVYIQWYHTEKEATYQLDKGTFAAVEPKDLLSDSGLENFAKRINSLASTFLECSGAGPDRIAHECCTRIEVRVQGEARAQAILRKQDLPANFIQSTMIQMQLKAWWEWKTLHVAAIGFVVKAARDARAQGGEGHIIAEHLRLLAVAAFTYNGLMYGMKQKGDLWLAAEACMPRLPLNGAHIETEEQRADMGCGKFVLAGLWWDEDVHKPWRVPATQWVSSADALQQLARAFKAATFEDLQDIAYGKGQRVRKAAQSDNLTRSRTHQVRDLAAYGPPTNHLDLSSLNLAINEIGRATGADVDAYRAARAAYSMDDDDDDEALTVDRLQTKFDAIFQGFAPHVVGVSPNQAGGRGKYILLSDEQCAETTTEVFHSLDWTHVWRRASVRVGTIKDLRMIFDRLFPPRDEGERYLKKQNYVTATWFEQWVKTVRRLKTSAMVEAVRAKLWNDYFSKFLWVPDAATDKIWVTSSNKKGRTVYGAGEGAAPHIFVNGTEMRKLELSIVIGDGA